MTAYNTLSDNELIVKAQSGDINAQDILLEKHRDSAKRIARTFIIMGADFEDIVQEGMMGLFKAIQTYDPNREASFGTYANICITRRIINTIKNASGKKHAPLNFYVPLDFSENMATDSILNLTDDNPETLLILKEESEKIIGTIYNLLSPFETQVLNLYLRGKSYTDIALLLNKSSKSIDNAIQRIRNKAEAIQTQ